MQVQIVTSGLAQWQNSGAYIQEHVSWNSSHLDRLLVVSQTPLRQLLGSNPSQFIIHYHHHTI